MTSEETVRTDETAVPGNAAAPMPAPESAAVAVGEKPKKPLYRKWWFWVIVVVVVAAIGSSLAGDEESIGTQGTTSNGNLTITDGSASPSSPREGETVTVTAASAPNKQVFNSWEIATGSVVFENPKAATTSFVMPEGKVEIHATYRDADPHTNEGTGSYAKAPISDVSLTGDAFGAYINGTLTNNTGRDISYAQIEFSCYDADGNLLGSAWDNVNHLGAGKTWKFKAIGLFSGGKSAVASYEFTDIDGI